MADPSDSLRFEGVSKTYGSHRALVSLDLSVRRGEFLTLLGPSGSGKTTTLMIAAGFVEPSAGQVWLDGRDITDLPPHRRNLGVVFQSYALFPHRTVAQNIAFPLRMRGVPKGEQARRVADVLRLVRLEGLGERCPRQLSGGQQQRVALARAIVFNPPLLLMDEPLGALDKNLRTEMQLELKRLHLELGLTVVYVTHDQEEALSMSDRIAVMRDGAIEQLDEPWAIYERPVSRFVALFIGDTNVLSGRLESGADGSVFRLGPAAAFPVPPGPAPGDATVVLRAERLALVAAPIEGRGSLTATVSGVAYLGDAWLVEARLADGQELRLRVDLPRERVPRTGETVTIDWAIDDARVLPA